MNSVRQPENRPGPDPQIVSSGSNADFSNAGDHLGKIPSRRAGGNNLSGSNRRTVFRLAHATLNPPNHLPPNLKPDINQTTSIHCPFFRGKPSPSDLLKRRNSGGVAGGGKCAIMWVAGRSLPAKEGRGTRLLILPRRGT